MKPTRTIERGACFSLTKYELPNGDHHREDGPAVIYDYDSGGRAEIWKLNGRHHRYGGPAFIAVDGSISYYIHGKRYNRVVNSWLEEHGYSWKTMKDIEKWELEIFMRTLC